METIKFFEETAEQKAQRHAEKERRLQKQINGNAPYRTSLIESIIKDNLFGHQEDLSRLLKKDANYINCEEAYNKLFMLINVMGTTEQQAQAEAFKKKLPALQKLAEQFKKKINK